MKDIEDGFAKKNRKHIRPGTLLRIMFVITACGIGFSASAQLLDKMVSLSLTNVTFGELLDELSATTKIKFAYSVDQLDVNQTVSVHADKRTLRDILDELFEPLNIEYKVHEHESIISLKRKHDTEQNGNNTKPKDPLSNKQVTYGLIEVSGRVRDENGQPMAGVNVLAKGTTSGTSTDAAGNYRLKVEQTDILVFSFIGFAPIEELVGTRGTIDVVLIEDVKSLAEVVVNAGYYTTTKESQTGNITRVSAAEIQRQPVSNPLAALQAKVPGLEITQSTGVAGGSFKVRIRGTNSISNGNDPLFIVNGVPYTSTTMAFNETSAAILGNALGPNGGTSPLNNINPSDIESIEVLKDADATAIYGSRGANGVILITTKKGQDGIPKVNFSLYNGIGMVARKQNLLNTGQYLKMRHEAFANDDVTPTVSNARDLLTWDTTRYTDWQKELIGGTAQTTDAQLSVSGGDVRTQFSVGSGYHRESGVFPGKNNDERISTHINISNSTPDQKLKTYATASYSAASTNLLSQDLTNQALYLPPNAPPLYNESGALNWVGWNASGSFENPLAYLNRRYESNTNTLMASVEVGYAILPNLEVKSRMGYTNINVKSYNTVPISSLAPSIASSSFNTTRFSNSSFQNWIVEPQANWKPQLGTGKFDVLIGTQFLGQHSEGLAQTATGFSSEALMKNIASAPDLRLGTNYYSEYKYNALFARVNYSLEQKYFINLTGRRDGSSRFGPGKQFANFGAFGLTWIFTKEQFIAKAVPFLSFGKIRGSFGLTGNDQLTDYQYLDAYESSAGSYQNVIGLTPVRLSNTDFAWEKNRKLEGAIDLGYFHDRIVTSVSLYRNRTSSQLVGYPLPPTTGFTSIQANFPAEVQNAGVEIELTAINIQRTNFSWSTTFNITRSRNKLLAFPGLENSTAYAEQYVVGKPLNIRKLYHFAGIDRATGELEFQDINEDGNLDSEDQKTIKFIGPDFYGGLQNSFSFKGFTLDVLFQFVKQTGNNYILNGGVPGRITNQPDVVFDGRWRAPGDIAERQAFTQRSSASLDFINYKFSDRAISDASFIRLKNVFLSYSLPTMIMRKMRVSATKIFIQSQNLLTITNYEGLDPETQGTFLPPLRVLTAGVSATF